MGAVEEAPSPVPLLGTGELALSLRHGDRAPVGAVQLEITGSAVRAGEQAAPVAISLGAAHVQRAIESAVAGKSAVVLAVHAATPYRVLSEVLSFVQESGVNQVSFLVRGPGGEAGQLAPASVTLVDNEPDEGTSAGAIGAAVGHSWDNFVTRWETIEGACRRGKSASCARRPDEVASGGELKLVLSAVDEGHTVGFYRLGEPLPERSPPRRGGKRALAVTDPVAELENEPPAATALFQWRAHEATASPSPISATVGPVCGAETCRVVVRAGAATLAARVLSLLGAAFPDGKPAPVVLFERSP